MAKGPGRGKLPRLAYRRLPWDGSDTRLIGSWTGVLHATTNMASTRPRPGPGRPRPRRTARGPSRSPAGSHGWPRSRRRLPLPTGDRHLYSDRSHAARAAGQHQRPALARPDSIDQPVYSSAARSRPQEGVTISPARPAPPADWQRRLATWRVRARPARRQPFHHEARHLLQARSRAAPTRRPLRTTGRKPPDAPQHGRRALASGAANAHDHKRCPPSPAEIS